MSFISTDPHSHQGENIWFTPKEITQHLGIFDMDVCTVSYRPYDISTNNIEHDRGMNSLNINWHGLVWMNPPYGKEIVPFLEKFSKHNNGIALVFARMGTPWMQKWIESKRCVFFLRKRIAFINKFGEKGTNAGADSCLLIGGKDALERVAKSGLQGVFVNIF